MAGNPIAYGFIFGGIVFYFFTITALIRNIREQNFSKSFLRLVDANHDEVITHKQIDIFNPCEGYDRKRLVKAFDEFGRKVDIIDLADELSSKTVLNLLDDCLKGHEKLAQPAYLASLNRKQIVEQMIQGYDVNKDSKISFIQHQIGNIVNKKVSPDNRNVFRFFDKNHDWAISKKELEKTKVSSLLGFLGSGGKRRAPPKKH